MTAGAGGATSACPRCGVAAIPSMSGGGGVGGRCRCDLSAVKETPVCVPSTPEIPPHSYPITWVTSLGGVGGCVCACVLGWGVPPGSAREGLAGFLGGMPQAGAGGVRWGRGEAGAGDEEQGWEWEAGAPLGGG